MELIQSRLNQSETGSDRISEMLLKSFATGCDQCSRGIDYCEMDCLHSVRVQEYVFYVESKSQTPFIFRHVVLVAVLSPTDLKC